MSDAGGQRIPGATVILRNPSNYLVYFGQTQGDGSYSIGQVPSGTYTMVVLADGYRALVQSSTVISQAVTLNASLTTQLAMVTGQLVEAAGNAVPDGNISILDSAGNVIGIAETQRDGTFTITTAYGTNLTLVAAAVGGKPVEIVLASVLGGTTNVRLVVAPEAAVAGVSALAGKSASVKLGVINTAGIRPAASNTQQEISAADSTATLTPGQQAAAMQAELRRLQGLSEYTEAIPEKSPPPTPPASCANDAIDTYNHNLYAQWMNAKVTVMNDRDALKGALRQFIVDLTQTQVTLCECSNMPTKPRRRHCNSTLMVLPHLLLPQWLRVLFPAYLVPATILVQLLDQ